MTLFYNGKLIDNKQAVSNAFNDYFINIAHELMQNISNTNVSSFKIFLNNRNNNSMFIFPIAEEELIDVVNKFKSKKSSDFNEFSMEMIKKIINLISKPLTNIFKSGIFPEEVKIAKVRPVFKTGKKTSLVIIDQFLFYLNFEKFLKNCLIKD